MDIALINKILDFIFCTINTGWGIYIIISGVLMFLFVRRALKQPLPELSKKLPKAAIIAPCKDVDPDFEENMAMLLKQDYPDYEIFFVTIDEQDDNYPILKKLVAQSPVPAHLYLGGLSRKRAQKLDNMLKAIENLSDDIEVFVFIDSDSRITEEWLKNMVVPLMDKNVGSVTGFRWYLPEKGRLISYIHCLWTAILYGNLYTEAFIATWGGSMSILRSTYEKLNLKEKWDLALSDDCVLNEELHKAKLKIVFNPRCMTSSLSPFPFWEVFGFATRQAIIAKFCLSGIWWVSTCLLTLVHGIIFLGIYKIIYEGFSWTAAGMLSFIPFTMIQEIFVMLSIQQLTKERKGDRLTAKISWAFLMPFAYLFLWLSFVAALFLDKFEWRGIYYKMDDAYKTTIYKAPERFNDKRLESAEAKPLSNN